MQLDTGTVATVVNVIIEAMQKSYNFDARTAGRGQVFKGRTRKIPPDAARECIRDDDMTLQEIAFLLGFSDQSNFSRAFRRWTGRSPKDWRKNQ